ncbi:MAG: TRAP-type transport system, periplasmic component, predicted N-acetylneuraminate-binding protein [Bacillota bacterium]|nr:TRAP-type transport system, periplasmic component, predicted N-acetylneuraminate-binding protein [Bacillota bacterium]
MDFYEFKYSKDDIFILSLDTKSKNKNEKGFLDVKIYSRDKTPVNNANIEVYSTKSLNEYDLKICASGHNPIQVNKIKILPGCVTKLNIELPQRDVRELSMALGINFPKDSLHYIYAAKFAEEVNLLSTGKMKINIYTDGKLGRERDMLRNLKLNESDIQFTIMPISPQIDLVPKLSVFNMMMVYSNIEDFRNILNNEEFYGKISSDYLNNGYKLFGIIDEGFKQMATNKEIQNMDDFKGIKVRTIQNRDLEAFLKSLGAIVVPLPWGEIYTSLRHGFIDSTANPYEDFVSLKLYELQKYVIETKHTPDVDTFITSNNFYKSLSNSEKAIIDEAALRATTYVREIENERIEEMKKILIDNGMTILTLPEETIDAMKQKALPIYERIRKIVNEDELINLYLGTEGK